MKNNMQKLALTALLTAGIGSIILTSNTVTASAKASVRSYQNIKNAPYKVVNKKATVYTTAKLNHKKTVKLGSMGKTVTGYYAAHVTKNGHKAVYYKFKTSYGSTGWVWRGWLKKASTSTNTNSNLPSNWYDGSPEPTTIRKTPTNKSFPKLKSFSNSEYIQSFVDNLNKERAQRNIAPVTLDQGLTNVANQRTAKSSNLDSHTDNAGNPYFIEIAKQLGISYARSECLGQDKINAVNHGETSDDIVDPNEKYNIITNTSANIAKSSLLEYIYFDQKEDNGHRDILLNPAYNVIGVSTLQSTFYTHNDYVENAVIMGTK